MKPEQAERFFIEGLFQESIDSKKVDVQTISHIEKLTGDASTRRYYRITCPSKSYVVCLGEPTESESDFVEVQKVLQENNVRTPLVFDTNLEKGYILEEDLGDQTLLKRLALINSRDEELKLYKEAVDSIIKVHQIEKNKYENAPFSNLSFDSEKLLFEVNFTQKYFLEKLIGITLGTTEKKILDKSFKKVCSQLEAQKMVVTHRDYHSRNIMVVNEEQIIIDFQDARMGIPQYDLVSLLEDCYYELSHENIIELKNYYWDNFLSKKNYQSNFDEFCYYYDLMAIQRIYKALGSFSYIFDLRGDRRYLKYIGYGFEKLKGFLLKYPEFNDLRKLLSRVYYEY